VPRAVLALHARAHLADGGAAAKNAALRHHLPPSVRFIAYLDDDNGVDVDHLSSLRNAFDDDEDSDDVVVDSDRAAADDGEDDEDESERDAEDERARNARTRDEVAFVISSFTMGARTIIAREPRRYRVDTSTFMHRRRLLTTYGFWKTHAEAGCTHARE